MKNQLFSVVLVLLAAYTRGAVIEPKAVADDVIVTDDVKITEHIKGVEPTALVANRNLNIGWINSGDRILFRNFYYRAPVLNAVQSQDVSYFGSMGTRISAIRVNEIGQTQFASSHVVAGGVNTSTVIIRLTSARGNGYYFSVEIWGR